MLAPCEQVKIMKKYNAAIIGCGAISPIHANAIRGSSRANLYAVCDILPEKAGALAEKYGCKWFADYKELLMDTGVDVVHICTPHYLHRVMAIDAMKSGKHVLVEKPIATRSIHGEEMVNVSRETGMRLGACFQNRYNDTSVKIKQFLESGKAGRIIGARAFVTWHRDRNYYAGSDWRGKKATEGGGVLINQAIHTLDLLQWFLGDVERVKGNVDTRLLKDVIEVEDTAEATIIFKSGAVALFYATNCYAKDSPVEMEIICEKAVLKLSGGLTISCSDGTREYTEDTDLKTGGKPYWGCGHAALIEDYYDCLAEEKPFRVDGRQALPSLRIIEAVYDSSRTGKDMLFKK